MSITLCSHGAPWTPPSGPHTYHILRALPSNPPICVTISQKVSWTLIGRSASARKRKNKKGWEISPLRTWRGCCSHSRESLLCLWKTFSVFPFTFLHISSRDCFLSFLNKISATVLSWDSCINSLSGEARTETQCHHPFLKHNYT